MAPTFRAIRIGAAAGALMLATAATAQAANPAPSASSAPLTRVAVLGNADGQFQQIDANHDGVLTKTEIETFERARILAAAVARNKAIFDQLDQNHDGVLSREEFGHLVGNAPQINVDSLVGQLDSNHDGKISREEYRAAILGKFDRADTNHDGVLSPAEERAAAPALAPAPTHR